MKTRTRFWILTLAMLMIAPLAKADTKPKLLGMARWDKERAYVWIVGGYDANQKKWLDDSAAQKAFYPGTSFQLFGTGGKIGATSIDRAELEEVPRGYVAKMRDKPSEPGIAVALANVAEPMPRALKKQSLNSEPYRKAAAAIFRANGLKVSLAKLQQHFRIDLNGDGIEEVLLGAQSDGKMGESSHAEMGDYSLAAIRFYDPSRKKDKVQTKVLGIETVKDRITFGAPMSYSILGAVDVDGDGKMEIIVHYRYYEGEGIQLFRFDGHSIKSVLSAGWGV